MPSFLKPRLDWLLVFVPLAAFFEYFSGAEKPHTLIFLFASFGIVPLAGWMGKATEQIAEQTSEGVGGLLNATFGNAAELIIALVALHDGLYGVVKASLTGSIIGNLLLVLGASFLAGGLKFRVQKFSAAGAQTQSTMLILAAIALVMPAAFHHLGGAAAKSSESGLSMEISIILLVVYGLGLVFTLRTHTDFFSGVRGGHAEPGHDGGHGGAGGHWSMGRSITVLCVATAFVAWVAEMLVGSVEHAAHALGMSDVFVGVIVVAIVGNAAEHSTAVLVARKNRMDLSLGIAIGSSLQIALFVAPVLVLASYFVGPGPMDLVFTPAEVLAVVVSVWICGQMSQDGESNWLEGVLLIAVYLVLAIVFYFLPVPATAGR